MREAECQAGTKVEIEVLVIERAAGIAGIGVLHALPGQEGGKLVHGKQRRAGILADRDRVAGMVLMAMGQRHMGHTLDRLVQRDARSLAKV